jgi:hypothetical protein
MIDQNLDIEFFESGDRYGPVKATVQKSGRLGFSSGAIKLLEIDGNKLFKIGRKKLESSDSNNQTLLLIPVDTEDEFTFRALKAGDYYYLKTKRLLNQLSIDYRNENVIFDIDEVNEDGKTYYKLHRKKKRSSTV